MVKFGKSKLKALNKLAKKQNAATSSPVSNKIIKRKVNVDKKVTFQKEVLLKETIAEGSPLVKSVTSKEIKLLNDLSKKAPKGKKEKVKQDNITKPKIKPVEKHKKRQKTQINDTKLLLKLMNKK
ncbi:hypothetical protein JYU34_019542 [Plutella xylostella]|uniref:Uncharacterized protein n=1 Tax=Plutella xylostella TaxID=51655 RepID=A0ABQ7PYD8_PLUXY|nr:hypothetical protein JYU34_019542 [Plutella xylostella]